MLNIMTKYYDPGFFAATHSLFSSYPAKMQSSGVKKAGSLCAEPALLFLKQRLLVFALVH